MCAVISVPFAGDVHLPKMFSFSGIQSILGVFTCDTPYYHSCDACKVFLIVQFVFTIVWLYGSVVARCCKVHNLCVV